MFHNRSFWIFYNWFGDARRRLKFFCFQIFLLTLSSSSNGVYIALIITFRIFYYWPIYNNNIGSPNIIYFSTTLLLYLFFSFIIYNGHWSNGWWKAWYYTLSSKILVEAFLHLINSLAIGFTLSTINNWLNTTGKIITFFPIVMTVNTLI